MTPPSESLRVEQALRLLPQVEAMAPLRDLLLATSEGPGEAGGPMWRAGTQNPLATIGKRQARSDVLRREVAGLATEVTHHLSALFDACVSALERHERGDTAGAVDALRQAGQREEAVGRLGQARAWYEVAGRLAAELRDRRPEIETLTRLASVSAVLGRYLEGARQFQRALVLAEAEFDQPGAIAACEGLGRIAMARGEWTGALAWFTRTLRLAEAGGDPLVIGRQHHRLAILALRRGDLAAVPQPLQKAIDAFEGAQATIELTWVLRTRGHLDARLGRATNAHAAYREALAWLTRPPGDFRLELAVRLDVAELHTSTGHFLEAEAEIRRVEQAAVERRQIRWVTRAYALMGRLRGLQRDQGGFVFFEEAMHLIAGLETSPALEGHVLREYGEYCMALGLRDEARAYLERARELFESVGRVPDRDAVRADLERITA